MKRLGWLFVLLTGCTIYEAPELPPTVDVSGVFANGRGPADLRDVKLEALYVVPQNPRTDRPLGIHVEDRSLALVDLVAVLDEDGALYMNDVLHVEAPSAYGYEKISPRQIRLTSLQGRFAGAQHLFTPDPNVLAALDTGYAIEVRVKNVHERLVFRPLYDAALYRPYERDGQPGPEGRAGFVGKSGSSGSSGSDGSKGSDGMQGAKGEDGSDGDGGSSGSAGRPGKPGGPGGPGDPGPDLELTFRPIYSKFYPDEELVFLHVEATYRHAGQRAPYNKEERRYIFHADQQFRITTRGGVGGSGGAGGAGGSGGDGGDGADGGDGRDGAAGAPGGPGGRGGDGGNVRAQIIGSATFTRRVRAAMRLQSIAGDGGSAGLGGMGGAAGAAGDGGRGGDGGDGGRGGSGTPRGNDGRDGDDGLSGKDGDRGSRGANGPSGVPGPRGRAQRTPW